MTSRLVLGIAMMLALAGAVPQSAHAYWDDRPDPSTFEESLSPHGYWLDDAQFGRVWRPYMDWGWRPYLDGRWIWTSYGWTWASDEPWGWTFHYGRWGFSNLYGWVWTPGYVWGPAWVNWYWGDGFVGWVPLGPVGFVIAPGYWSYVHDYNFCSPHVNTVIVGHERLPNYVVHHRDTGWGRERAPDVRDIEHVSRHRIEHATGRPEDSIAPWVRQRIERGERVRERVDDRGHERIIEHAGRPAVADDGGRGPATGDRLGHGARATDRGLGSAGSGAGTIQHGQPTRDDRPGRIPDDRSRDERIVVPRGGTGDTTVVVPRGGATADDHGWARPPVVHTPQPYAPPPPRQVQPPSAPGPQAPTYRGGGSGPMIIERPGARGGAPAAPSARPSVGGAPGGATIQHAPTGGGGSGPGSGSDGGRGGHGGGGAGTGGGSIGHGAP